jgi:hypothetical protein
VVRVRLAGGGTANWSTPVRVSDTTWRATYETLSVHRYTLEDGRRIHSRTRYQGVDDVDGRGEFTGGFGSFEGVDDDGHWLHGCIDWGIRGEQYVGIYVFQFGTGKWEGAGGAIETVVWAEPDRADQVMPPTGPIRFWGFHEGEGELSLPRLEA